MLAHWIQHWILHLKKAAAVNRLTVHSVIRIPMLVGTAGRFAIFFNFYAHMKEFECLSCLKG